MLLPSPYSLFVSILYLIIIRCTKFRVQLLTCLDYSMSSHIFFHIFTIGVNLTLSSYFRTTGSTCFYGSSGTTLGWLIRSTQTTPWTWTPQCWTPFGNPTCSLRMKREQTSTRWLQTTNCCGYFRTETSSTASGDQRCNVPVSHIWTPHGWLV